MRKSGEGGGDMWMLNSKGKRPGMEAGVGNHTLRRNAALAEGVAGNPRASTSLYQIFKEISEFV